MKQDTINIRQQMIRHQVAVKALGIVVGTLILISTGLWPLIQLTGSTMRKIEQRSKDEELISRKVSILSRIDQQVLKERTQIIKAALPEEKDVIAYLGAVDGLSKELGLSFGGITVSPGEVSGESQKSTLSKKTKSNRKVASLNVLDTDIKITGSRDGIYAFLRQVEMTLPLMQISNVVVSKLENDLYSMSLSLGMLWAPTPAIDLKGQISLFTEKEEAYFQKLNKFRSFTDENAFANVQLDAVKSDLFKKD